MGFNGGSEGNMSETWPRFIALKVFILSSNILRRERLGSGTPQPQIVGQQNGLGVTGELSSLRLGRGAQTQGAEMVMLWEHSIQAFLCLKRAKGVTHLGHVGRTEGLCPQVPSWPASIRDPGLPGTGFLFTDQFSRRHIKYFQRADT